jgi:Tol biopolymer transport system component
MHFKMRFAIVTGILAMSLIISGTVLGQDFGQNKVQYTYFKWHIVQSEHFDVYFTQGGDELAQFVAETAEKAYREISASYQYVLPADQRITIVAYNSHNDFEQTNVSFEQPEESVGGFTEFFKNRVVIPFEGSYEEFRHVIHHELSHAVMMNMLFGTGIQSVVSGITRAQLPIWFIEGMAEYQSRHGWDIESDMFMRDATINGYVTPLSNLSGYLIYKGGQSVLYYVAQRYGRQKIGEILNKLRGDRETNRAFKSAIGIDLQELSKRWEKYLRKTYWPSLADMQSPEDFAERLTDHVKDHNFINTSPAISPRGDQLAFLSDRSDYFDIYLMSTIDGKIIRKLVSGQKKAKFEELHWERPGISWAPTGDRITFAAKAGGQDAIYIVNVETADVVKEYTFDLDGLFSPSWSPQGDQIAFVGTKDGHADIYSVTLSDGKLKQYTRDAYSDLDPCWSLDAKSIVFASDRQEDLSVDNSNIKMYERNYSELDLYELNLAADTLKRLTDTPTQERSPVFAPEGNGLTYVSDENGAYNLFNMNLETGETKALTNILTGCFLPSWSRAGSRLAFASFYDWGYDIYLFKNPLAVPEIKLPLTTFVKEGPLPPLEEVAKQESDTTGVSKGPLPQYVFGKTPTVTKREEVDTTNYRMPNGNYRVKPYHLKFSPDIVYANAGYSAFFGLQGSGQILVSDVLGNHLIFLATDLYYNFENSNFTAFYFYLPRRIDYGAGIYHNVYFFNGGDIRDRNYGVSLSMFYPLSRFNRIELSLDMMFIDRSLWNPYTSNYDFFKRRRVFMPGLAYVHDTAIWGITGPTNGSRYMLGVYYSPNLQGNSTATDRWGLDFRTVIGDYRRYWRITKDQSFATRFAAGLSEGNTPQRFFLGGVTNWINRHFANAIPAESIEDIYFSSLVLPFRGYDYYEKQGTRFAVTNLEYRFPLIRFLFFGWPLPIIIPDIRGAVFTDIGSAWEDGNFRATTRGEDGLYHLQDILMGYGTGIRINLGFFVLQWDVAWNTDLVNSSKPRYYLSLGPEF